MYKGANVSITRGKYAGRHGVVQRASQDMAGFWWVQLFNKQGKLGDDLLFSVGQLLVRKGAPADG